MTDKIATIFIPFADYHKQVVQQAFRSAVNQTVECEVVLGASPGTPALLRNQAMNAKSPFVVFLDADDTLEPNFVEECIRTYETGKYIYTGWYQEDKVMMPRPCNPFLAHDFNDGRGGVGGYHLVTTLFPTELFKYLGGFIETLPGGEDIDFYMRAQRAGVCGVLCDKPLVHYNGAGETRGKHFAANPEHDAIKHMIELENGGLQAMAGCCGISSGGEQANLTGQQPGDIAAQTLYAPTTQTGRATGRWYPRPLFMGQVIMVDPRDVEKMPELFKAVVDLNKIAPDAMRIRKEAGLI